MSEYLEQQLLARRQAIERDNEAALRVIYPGLVTEVTVNVIPENIFSSYFMPGFLGQNPDKNWLANWIGVAGSPTAEVSVIGRDGKEIFRVPPVLLSRDVLFANDGIRLSEVLNASKLLENTLQGNKAYLYDAMSAKAKGVQVPTSMNAAVKQWEYIFSLYGITTKTKAPVAPADDSDMFEY